MKNTKVKKYVLWFLWLWIILVNSICSTTVIASTQETPIANNTVMTTNTENENTLLHNKSKISKPFLTFILLGIGIFIFCTISFFMLKRNLKQFNKIKK